MGVAILVSDKMDLGAKKIPWDGNRCHVLSKESMCRKDPVIPVAQTSNN